MIGRQKQKMEDKITFLGTGGGRVVVANQIRATGGFIINLKGRQIHVDPGPGALVRARQYGVKAYQTDIIFASHSHLDHCNDLNAIIYAMTLGGINKKGILISTGEVINGTQKERPWLSDYYRDKLKNLIVASEKDTIKIGNLTLHTTKTKHDINTNIGFRLESPDLTIGYTSDTTYFDDLPKEFKNTTVLIANILRPGNDKWKTHLCGDDIVKLATEVRPELMIIQHYGAKLIKSSPLYEAREIQRRSGIRTIAATDGLSIPISGFKKRIPTI